MTREEAINILRHPNDFGTHTYAEEKEVLSMAIETLKEPVLQSDGTLIVDSEYYDKTKRILLEDGHNGTLFYPD